MKIVPFSDLSEEAWDDCCEESASSWLYHRFAWIRIEQTHFVAENASFGVVERNRLLAVQPLYVSDLGLGAWIEKLVHSGVHRHTGLACRNELSTSQVKEIQAATMSRIKEIAQDFGADRIQLNVQNLTPESLSLDRQEIPFWITPNSGFFLGLNFTATGVFPVPGMATCCADQVVDLRRDEARLFSSLEESCRRAVRKAIGSRLEMEVYFGLAAAIHIDDYYSLAKLSAQRTGESLAPKSYFDDLIEVFAADRCAILFVRHDGKIVAAVLLGIDKGAASYMGGVSDSDFFNLRINDFAHWSAILWAKRAGLLWYRLGPIFPELPADAPICKVSRFKSKLGGRPFSIIQGSKFIHPEKYLVGGAELLAKGLA